MSLADFRAIVFVILVSLLLWLPALLYPSGAPTYPLLLILAFCLLLLAIARRQAAYAFATLVASTLALWSFLYEGAIAYDVISTTRGLLLLEYFAGGLLLIAEGLSRHRAAWLNHRGFRLLSIIIVIIFALLAIARALSHPSILTMPVILAALAPLIVMIWFYRRRLILPDTVKTQPRKPMTIAVVSLLTALWLGHAGLVAVRVIYGSPVWLELRSEAGLLLVDGELRLDYVNNALPEQELIQALPPRGLVILSRDSALIGQFRRIDNGRALTADELRLRYRRLDGYGNVAKIAYGPAVLSVSEDQSENSSARYVLLRVDRFGWASAIKVAAQPLPLD